MPRLLRIEYPGAIYHIVNRGNRGDPVFRDDSDRRAFLNALGEVCGKTGWRVHAYVLLADHFHLALTTPQPNLVAGMKWLLGTYTNRFNRRHRIGGHLFRGRYRAVLVDPAADYLETVCDYIHLNPSRAGEVRADQSPADYLWGSLPFYLRTELEAPSWWQAAGSRSPQELAERLERLRQEPAPEAWLRIRRGWCFGSKAFGLEVGAQLAGGAPPRHHGELPAEALLAKAEGIIRDGLAELDWSEQDLATQPKMAIEKARLALRLRRETTLGLAWIAPRLHLGSIHTARNVLARLRRTEAAEARSVAPPPRDATASPEEDNLTFDVRWD